jgi:hypothetical protein
MGLTRLQFVKMADAVLVSLGDPPPIAAKKAEALAAQMDMLVAILGATEAGSQPPIPQPSIANVGFPSPNPAAVAPAVLPPEPEPEHPNLIIPATTIPDRVEPVASAPPLRSIRQSSGRMKVEDLSQLIQERTPPKLTFDVPLEDGNVRRVTFMRNVISMHAFDSVQLIYFPPGVTMSARESAEVQAVISIDDLPVDLSAILKKLTEQASQSIRPRGPVMSVAPPATSGPVTHSSDNYDDPGLKALTDQTRAVFNSMG